VCVCERDGQKKTSPDKQRQWAKREGTLSMTTVVGNRLNLLLRPKGHAQRVESSFFLVQRKNGFLVLFAAE
jgi:hypothetical protein